MPETSLLRELLHSLLIIDHRLTVVETSLSIVPDPAPTPASGANNTRNRPPPPPPPPPPASPAQPFFASHRPSGPACFSPTAYAPPPYAPSTHTATSAAAAYWADSPSSLHQPPLYHPGVGVHVKLEADITDDEVRRRRRLDYGRDTYKMADYSSPTPSPVGMGMTPATTPTAAASTSAAGVVGAGAPGVHRNGNGNGNSSSGRLEALPEGFVVTARATLQEELDGWTIPRGYSMRINGTRSHGHRQKIRMVCFRGGRSRLRPRDEETAQKRRRMRDGQDGREDEPDPECDVDRAPDAEHLEPGRALSADLPPRRRKPTTDRVSKKCECPFRFELVEVGPGADRYAVHYTNNDHMRHNHAAADLMLDPRARKLPRALKAEVDQWLRGAVAAAAASSTRSARGAAGSAEGTEGAESGTPATSWTIAKIQAELQRRGYGHVLDFDLRNRKRALLHKERMAQLKQAAQADQSGNGDIGGGIGGGGGGGASVTSGADDSTSGDTPRAFCSG